MIFIRRPGQVDGQVLNAGSKLRVLTSGNVLSRVVDELDLVNDKEFFDPTPSFGLSGLFGASNSEPAADPKLTALANLAQRVGTKADEKSFVATLSVSSESTDKAIAISQAIVKSFQDELAKAEADGAGRAAAALDDRLAQLKAGVQDAEEKVEAYKRENNLAASSDGQLVSTQTLTQLNGQVVEAQSRVIAAQASYDALVAAGPNASTSDTAASAALTALRDKAGSLQQQLDAQSMVYGPRHPTIVSLTAEVAAVNAQLRTELNRVIAAAKATLDEANASLAALRASSDTLTGNVFSDNESQVALRELERDAASKSAIYESFLSRARQITEREQIDTTNVRVISTAVPPGGPLLAAAHRVGHGHRRLCGVCAGHADLARARHPARYAAEAGPDGRLRRRSLIPPMGKRIVFHTASLRGGGAERVFVLMANELAARGHEVTLFTWNAEGPNAALRSDAVHLVDLGMPIHGEGYGKPATVRGLIRSAGFFRRYQPDAVYSAPEFANLVMALALLLARSRAKFFPSFHAAASLPSNDLGAKIAIWLSALVAKRASKGIAVSGGVGRDIAARGFPAEKVAVINNPLPSAEMRSASYPWQAELAAMGDGPVIATAGRLVPVKDHRTLLKAFAALRATRPTRLVIFGDGPLEAELRAYAEELGVGSHVLLPGYVNDPAACYAAADLFVSEFDQRGVRQCAGRGDGGGRSGGLYRCAAWAARDFGRWQIRSAGACG